MRKYIEWAIHIGAWIYLLFWTEFKVSQHDWFTDQYKGVGGYIFTNYHLWEWHSLLTVFKVIFFYWNVFYILPKYYSPKFPAQYLKPLTLSVICFMLMEVVMAYGYYKYSIYDQPEKGRLMMNYSLTGHFLPFGFTLILSFVYFSTKKWLISQKHIIKHQTTASELALIKSQINPHFLFNTLNNLFSMAIESNADQVAEGIGKLTEMMRYTLNKSERDMVSLSGEITYLQNYIELQKLRFNPGEVSINFNCEGNTEGIFIAPMILINYVENAFKHGISLKNESFISVEIRIVDNLLTFKVENSIHPQKTYAIDQNRNMGLENTRKLLDYHYINRYELKIENEEGIFKIELKLKLQSQKIDVLA